MESRSPSQQQPTMTLPWGCPPSPSKCLRCSPRLCQGMGKYLLQFPDKLLMFKKIFRSSSQHSNMSSSSTVVAGGEGGTNSRKVSSVTSASLQTVDEGDCTFPHTKKINPCHICKFDILQRATATSPRLRPESRSGEGERSRRRNRLARMRREETKKLRMMKRTEERGFEISRIY